MKKVQLSQDNRLEVYVSLCKEYQLPYDAKKAKKWLSSCSLEDEALIDRMQKIIPLYRTIAPRLGYSMKFVDLSILTDPSVWAYVNEIEAEETVERRKPRKVLKISYDPSLLGWALSSVNAGDIEEILKLIVERGEVVLGTVLRAYEMLGRIPDGRIRQIVVHHYQQEDRTGDSNNV